MGFCGAITTALALGYTQMKKGHIAVDVLINTFSPKTRRILDSVNNGIGLLFFMLLGWQLAEKAVVLKNAQEVTETLRFPYYPFTMGVALGCVVLAGVLFRDLLHSIRKENSR
jgi:TRAP-type C4-dicarboxylate transport system permease small subunit